MIKKLITRLMIGIGIALGISTFNIFNQGHFLDSIFIVGMSFLILGGFQFVSDMGLFNFQKYAFHRVSRKLPAFSRLFLNGNARFGDYEEKLSDSDKAPAQDYFDYLDRYTDQSNLSYGRINLICAIFLIALSIILNQML